MRTLSAASLALVLLVSWSVSAGAQPCPTNNFSTGGTGGFFEDQSTSPIHGWFGTSYNLVAGTITSGLTGSGEAGSFAQLGVQDLYTLVGPASATPIAFIARVRFTGTAGGDVVSLLPGGPTCLGSEVALGLHSASLADQVEVSSFAAPACGPRTFDETLHLALTKLPGEVFPLRVNVSLTAGHTIQAQTSGQIVFVDLPPGYSVQSCQGYAVLPVATRLMSWSQLKRIYR